MEIVLTRENYLLRQRRFPENKLRQVRGLSSCFGGFFETERERMIKYSFFGGLAHYLTKAKNDENFRGKVKTLLTLEA